MAPRLSFLKKVSGIQTLPGSVIVRYLILSSSIKYYTTLYLFIFIPFILGLTLLPNSSRSSYHCCLESGSSLLYSKLKLCKPERNLRAEFHFHVINLVDAPNHQIDQDVGRAVHGLHGGGSYPRIVDVLIQNTVKDVFLFESLARIVRPPGGQSLEGAPVRVAEQEEE